MRRVLPIVSLLAFVGVAVYLLGPWGEEDRANEGPLGPVASPVPAAGGSEGEAPEPADSPVEDPPHDPAIVADMVELAEELSDPNATVAEDLEVIGELLRAYRRLLEGWPEGEGNREIVAALQGENRMQLIFLAAGHERVGAGGELLDRYGFPYEFRMLEDGMEVCSRGPDGEPGTDDDISLTV